MPLVHHELCFGCGRANLFGLLAELEPGPGGSVRGRCFIKQDHQGPVLGFAHSGVVAAALLEALGHVGRSGAPVQISFAGQVPVGEFLELEAGVEGGEAIARARAGGQVVAWACSTVAAAGT